MAHPSGSLPSRAISTRPHCASHTASNTCRHMGLCWSASRRYHQMPEISELKRKKSHLNSQFSKFLPINLSSHLATVCLSEAPAVGPAGPVTKAGQGYIVGLSLLCSGSTWCVLSCEHHHMAGHSHLVSSRLGLPACLSLHIPCQLPLHLAGFPCPYPSKPTKVLPYF